MDNDGISILGYFTTDTDATKAANELRSKGMMDVQVERISKYPGESTDEVFNPITGNISSLSTLTLGSDPGERDANVLSSVDPAASGMGPAEDQIQQRAYLVTVVCPHSDIDRAVKLMESFGGLV